MGIKRVTKKLIGDLSDIDAAIIVVNATDPQFATLALFYSAVSDISYFTVLNKCDRIKRSEIRPLVERLPSEVITTSLKEGRGVEEIKYRLSNWKDGSKIATLGVFNSGKTSLINALTGEDNEVGDIPGTTLKITEHKYNNQILLDTVGQVIDVSKPLMVSIDLSDCTTLEEKLRKCLIEDMKGIEASIEGSMEGLKNAIALLVQCVNNGGKLITCGAGASALVAMEMAGQAQETGIKTMAFTNNFATAQPISFAKGAFEDELALAEYFSGAVNNNDCIIGVSASGGTGFVFKFLELAQEKGAKTIAITENSDTPFGYAADVIIKSDAKPEGVSSSKIQVAHLAIGHALLITLADIRGVDAETSIGYMMRSICKNKKMGIK